VSKKHILITYHPELGWLMENLSESSGTYIHPKQFTQIIVGDASNSCPMLLEGTTIVKARTFTFEFKK